MRLSKGSLGLSIGLVWGLTILLATWWLVGNDSVGFYMSKLGTFYFGYSVSWLGALLGLIWGFVHGFVTGFFIAAVYNLVRPKFRRYIEPERV